MLPPLALQPTDGCTAALGCCYNPITAPGDWCYPMVNSSGCDDRCSVPPPSCPSPSPPANANILGCDLRQLWAADHGSCEAACCGEPRCTAWDWDSNLTAAQAPAACANPAGPAGAPRSCCWLKHCAGTPSPAKCGGAPHCDSWSGTSGRPPSPPPPPVEPSVCPPGWIKASWDSAGGCMDPLGSGSRPGLPAGYDCEVRRHAYRFAIATLPERGMFKTAFDALQLQACGDPAPAAEDRLAPPRFPPPPPPATTIYVDAAAAPGGDGSLLRPFATLEAAVDAAGQGPAGAHNMTVELRAGTYRTPGVVLTPRHSGLTIQNHGGEEAVVSGAVAVPNALGRWSVHNAATNTWRLDLKGQRGMPAEAFGLRVVTGNSTRRATSARYPNGDSELGTSLSTEALPIFPRDHDPVAKATLYESNPEDWPGVYWLREPEGGARERAVKQKVNVGRLLDFASSSTRTMHVRADELTTSN